EIGDRMRWDSLRTCRARPSCTSGGSFLAWNILDRRHSGMRSRRLWPAFRLSRPIPTLAMMNRFQGHHGLSLSLESGMVQSQRGELMVLTRRQALRSGALLAGAG